MEKALQEIIPLIVFVANKNKFSFVISLIYTIFANKLKIICKQN